MKRWHLYTGIVCWLFCAGFLLTHSWASIETTPPVNTEQLFDQAVKSYLKGNTQQAVVLLDRALSADPKNQRVRAFLLKLLVDRGGRLFLAEQYKSAYDYLARAQEMNPANMQVRQMLLLATQHAFPPKTAGGAADGSKSAAPETPEVPERSSSETYTQSMSAMLNLMNNFHRQQERQLEQLLVPIERIERLHVQSEQAQRNFFGSWDARLQGLLHNVSLQQRLIIYGFGVGLLLLAVLIWGFYLAVIHLKSRREEAVMKYQHEMLKMVKDMAGLRGASSYACLPGQAGEPERLLSVPESPVTEGKNQDLVQLLTHAIRSGNYKERAIAAVQMLSVDVDKALFFIREMARADDPFQRESIAHALGDQYHPLTLDLLLASLKDPEPRVVSATWRSLQRLEEDAQDMPAETGQQIRAYLKAAPENLRPRKSRDQK